MGLKMIWQIEGRANCGRILLPISPGTGESLNNPRKTKIPG